MPAINRNMASAMMGRPTPGASNNTMVQAHHARREINQAIRKSSNDATQIVTALRDGNKPVINLLRSGNNAIANLLKTEVANTQDQVKLTESLLQHQIRTYQKPPPALMQIYRKSQDLTQSMVSNTGLLVRKFHDTMIVKHRLERKQDLDYLENQRFRDSKRNEILTRIATILDPRKVGIFTRIFDGLKVVGGAIVGGSALLVGKMVKSVLNGQAFKVAGSIMKGMGGFFDDVVKYVGKPLGITNATGSRLSFSKLAKKLPILGLIVGSMMSINDALAGFDNADKLLNIKPEDLKFSDKIIAGAAMFFNKLSGGLTEKIAQYFGYASSPIALKAAYDKVIDFSKPYYEKFVQPILTWMNTAYDAMLTFTGEELEKLKQEGIVAYTKEALPRLRDWVVKQATMLKDWTVGQFDYISQTVSGYFQTEDKTRYLSLGEISTKMKNDLKNVGTQISNYILQTIIGYQGQVSDLFLVQEADGTTRPMNWQDVQAEVLKLGDTVYTSIKNVVMRRIDNISSYLLNNDMFSKALDADGNERDWLPLATIGSNIGKWLVQQLTNFGSEFGKVIDQNPAEMREAVLKKIGEGRVLLQGFVNQGIDFVFGTMGGALRELFSSPQIKDTSIMTPDELRTYLENQKRESESLIKPILQGIFSAMIGLTVDTGKYIIGKIWDSLTSAEFLGMAARGIDSVLSSLSPITQGAIIVKAITPFVTPIFTSLATGVGRAFQMGIDAIDWTAFAFGVNGGPMQRLVDSVKSVGRFIWNLDQFFLDFSKEAGPLTKGLRTFENGRVISEIVDAFGNVSKMYERVETTFFVTKKIANFFEGVGNAIATVKGIVPFMGKAMSLVSKIAWPLQIITSIFDFLSGITDTVTAERLGIDPSKVNFGDKLGSGIGSIVKGIVDLPITLINWLGRKLFSDNFSIGEGEDVAKYITKQISDVTRIVMGEGSAGDFFKVMFKSMAALPYYLGSSILKCFGIEVKSLDDIGNSVKKYVDDTFSKVKNINLGEILSNTLGQIGNWFSDMFSYQRIKTFVENSIRSVPGGNFIADTLFDPSPEKQQQAVAEAIQKVGHATQEDIKRREEEIAKLSSGFWSAMWNSREIDKLTKELEMMRMAYNAINRPANQNVPAGPTVPNAKGNAFYGGRVIPFALGGIGSDIVAAPTYFPMRDGNTGLMGEAGKEAIMPLRRDSQGRLGVHGLLPSVQFPDHLELASTKVELTQDAATKLGKAINDGIQPFINSANDLLEKATPVFNRNTDELKKAVDHLTKMFTPSDSTVNQAQSTWSNVKSTASHYYDSATNSMPSVDTIKAKANEIVNGGAAMASTGMASVGGMMQPKGGIDAFMAKTARAESGGNNSLVSDTGATGKYQFTIGTWNGIAEKSADRVKAYGGQVALITKANKGTANDPRRDVKSQEAYMRILTEDNAKAMGTDDPGALYLAHFMGADGAKAMLNAVKTGNGNALALDLMSPRLRSQMTGSNTNMTVVGGKTAQQVVDWAYGKMNGSSATMNYTPGASNASFSDIAKAKADELYQDGRITHAGLAKLLNITGASADVLMGVINSKDGYLPSASKEQIMAHGTGVGADADIANLNLPGVTHVGRTQIAGFNQTPHNDNSRPTVMGRIHQRIENALNPTASPGTQTTVRPDIKWNSDRITATTEAPKVGTQTVVKPPVSSPSVGTQTVPVMPAPAAAATMPVTASGDPSPQGIIGKMAEGLKSSAASAKATASHMLGSAADWLKNGKSVIKPQEETAASVGQQVTKLQSEVDSRKNQLAAYAKAAGFSSFEEFAAKKAEVMKTLPAGSTNTDIAKAMGYDHDKARAALLAVGQPQVDTSKTQAQLGTVTKVNIPSSAPSGDGAIRNGGFNGPLPEGVTVRPNFLNSGMKTDVMASEGAIRNGGFNGPVTIEPNAPVTGAIRNGGFNGPVLSSPGTSTMQLPSVVRKPATGQMGVANGDIPAPAAKTSFADTPNNFMMDTLNQKIAAMQEGLAKQAESMMKNSGSAPQQPNVNNTPHIDSIPVVIDDMGLMMINSYVM